MFLVFLVVVVVNVLENPSSNWNFFNTKEVTMRLFSKNCPKLLSSYLSRSLLEIGRAEKVPLHRVENGCETRKRTSLGAGEADFLQPLREPLEVGQKPAGNLKGTKGRRRRRQSTESPPPSSFEWDARERRGGGGGGGRGRGGGKETTLPPKKSEIGRVGPMEKGEGNASAEKRLGPTTTYNADTGQRSKWLCTVNSNKPFGPIG